MILPAAAEGAVAQMAAQRAAAAAVATAAGIDSSSSSSSSGGSKTELERLLRAALGSLQRVIAASELAKLAEPATCAAALQQASEAVGRVAALLRQYWATPACQAVARLDRAKAAAARSCAFLGCAEVGGVGSQGPAAGQRGTKKCSACSAV